MELEKMAKNISEELKELAKKEDELSQKTLLKEVSNFEKIKEQEKLKTILIRFKVIYMS